MDTNINAQELVNFVTESLKEGKSFAIEQAPLVAQEIVKFELVSSAAAIAAVIIIVSAVWSWIAIWAKRNPDDMEGRSAFGILILITTMAGLIIGGVNSYRFIKAYTAPRLVVLESIKNIK